MILLASILFANIATLTVPIRIGCTCILPGLGIWFKYCNTDNIQFTILVITKGCFFIQIHDVPMLLTNLIFDLGGVLVKTHWERVTVPIARISCLTPQKVMDEIETGEAVHDFMLGKLDRSEFHRNFTGSLGVKLDLDAFLSMWDSVIAPNNEINPLVKNLKESYQLVLASNTDVLHYARCLEVQQVLQLFDHLILSYELGRCKPDPEFFRSGLKRLAIPNNACVFIDDREENVEAAQALGIAGIQFVSTKQLETDLKDMGIL